MSQPAPSLRTKLFYGFGAVAFGVKDNGFGFLLLIFYNQVLGLPERWVGAAIMVALIVDACIDPIIGYLSDHLHSRWGRRHPFMYAAAIPVALSYYYLWDPPAGLSPAALFTYFIILAILVRVFIAIYEIPSISLAAELTDHYDQRTSILGFRFFFGWWGGLTMAVLAFAIFLQPDAAHPVGVLNPDGYRRYGLVASVLMAVAIFVSALGTHAYIPYLRKPPAKRRLGLNGVLREAREALSSRSFLSLFGTGFFAAMAAGLAAALNIYFNTYFWELSSNEISVLVAANFIAAAAALAIAPRLSNRYGGKKPAAIRTSIAAGIVAPLPIVLRLLDLFPANHSPALVPILLVQNIIVVTLIILASILISSMLADVAEETELSTGRRSEGLIFAANIFLQKAVSGFGIFASTLLLSAIGFPRGAQPSEVDPTIIRNLGLIYTPVVATLYFFAVAFLTMYSITRATHEATLERLADARVAVEES